MSSMVFKIALIFLLLVSCNVSGRETLAADFYVSPDGSDSFSGTLAQPNREKTDGPFKTVQRARNSVREEIKTNDSDIVVMLRGGRYLLTETICFGLQDSGKDGQRIIYRNYPKEEPVLSAAVEITGWRKATEDIVGLPAVAKGKIWVVDLAPGIKPFAALYQHDKRLTRAISKGFSALKDRTDPAVSGRTLYYPTGVILKNWDNINDVELVARPTWEWPMCIVPLASVDEISRTATVSVPSSFPFAKLHTQTPNDVDNVWIENAIEFLDKPGEWVLNTKQNKLFIWPFDGETPKGVLAPQLVELVKLEGNIDYNGPDDIPVRNITFQGLTFTEADRYKWPKDHIGWGLQDDWEIFDKPSAMVRFRGADNCSIENCRFINSAAAAMRLDLYCQDNSIHNNLIANLGGVGILLAGYGPGSKNVNKGNTITNNYIHDIGQLYWGSPGIYLWQSGENVVANNLIRDTPYSGIVISGRVDWLRSGRVDWLTSEKGQGSRIVRWNEVDQSLNTKGEDLSLRDIRNYFKNWSRREPFLHARRNVIEKNEIRGIMRKLSDGNGIYLAGCGKQNIIRLNYIHDCISAEMRAGIRTDGDVYETTIERNVLFKNGGTPVGIVIVGKNNVMNNIIADLLTGAPRYTGVPGDSTYYSLEAYPADGDMIQRNIIYSEDRGQLPCEVWASSGLPPEWKTTNTDYNCYFNTEDPNWLTAHFAELRPLGVETHSIFEDPMFIDLEHGNFALGPDSPALKLGFEQIDVSEAGLTRDFPKESLK